MCIVSAYSFAFSNAALYSLGTLSSLAGVSFFSSDLGVAVVVVVVAVVVVAVSVVSFFSSFCACSPLSPPPLATPETIIIASTQNHHFL